MAFDRTDPTLRVVQAAKERARAVLNEKSPKLTVLEKAMWQKLKKEQQQANEKAA